MYTYMYIQRKSRYFTIVCLFVYVYMYVVPRHDTSPYRILGVNQPISDIPARSKLET